jgi:hypothetical protein
VGARKSRGAASSNRTVGLLTGKVFRGGSRKSFGGSKGSRRSLGAKQGEGVTLVILTLRLVKARIVDLGTGRSTGWCEPG